MNYSTTRWRDSVVRVRLFQPRPLRGKRQKATLMAAFCLSSCITTIVSQRYFWISAGVGLVPEHTTLPSMTSAGSAHYAILHDRRHVLLNLDHIRLDSLGPDCCVNRVQERRVGGATTCQHFDFHVSSPFLEAGFRFLASAVPVRSDSEGPVRARRGTGAEMPVTG